MEVLLLLPTVVFITLAVLIFVDMFMADNPNDN